jgi:F-type H+-transporting ATPase subunit a
MHILRTILAAAFLLAGSFAWAAAEAGPAGLGAATPAVGAAAHEAHAATAHGAGHATKHELPRYAVKPHEKIPITNSMIVTWVVAALLILAVQSATRKARANPDSALVPQGAQNFWEWLLEGLHGLLEGIVGPELVKKTFWFFATIFIFILATNWFGLIPGVGTIGWGKQTPDGFMVSEPLLRGGNADLNMTAAMAMIFFFLWTVWALQANGLKGFILHLFGPKGDSTGLLKILMIVVFIFVGCLEVVSIAFRPISLSFRLFGNIFAGENMLESMAHLAGPVWGAILPIPFYFLELLVGLVQALVFMLLTAVFTMLICMHDDEHGNAEHH